jgi:hypothetical protein
MTHLFTSTISTASLDLRPLCSSTPPILEAHVGDVGLLEEPLGEPVQRLLVLRGQRQLAVVGEVLGQGDRPVEEFLADRALLLERQDGREEHRNRQDGRPREDAELGLQCEVHLAAAPGLVACNWPAKGRRTSRDSDEQPAFHARALGRIRGRFPYKPRWRRPDIAYLAFFQRVARAIPPPGP